ncbi:hypothetical protein [Nocardioides sp. KR10-350]|uniref:hypothetical protein n=1 Tax=Nocardioides cheoyonin TaxID=3156615 RepID=UPI0032B327E1
MTAPGNAIRNGVTAQTPTQEQLDWFLHRPGCEAPVVVATTGRRDGTPALLCKVCGRFKPLPPYLLPAADDGQPEAEPPVIRGRYRLECVRCDAVIDLHTPAPRIPLCERCKAAGSRPRRDHQTHTDPTTQAIA